MSNFVKIDIEHLHTNIFTLLESDWMLITAGEKTSYNTMTASWGGLGILWNKKVSYCFIRPSRYTFQFMEDFEYYTFTFFPPEYRQVLNICGTKSGRDTNKIVEAGITPLLDKTGAVYFNEANLVFVCEKIYYQDLHSAHFISPEIKPHYPQKNYHRMYVGEIISIYKKKKPPNKR